MRAPGECSGSFAIESAMDELAHALKMDPIELRLRNYAEMDQKEKLPFSSKSLKQCYELARTKFNWSRRQATPASIHDGEYLVGYGMATSTYPARRFPAKAHVELKADGTAVVNSATQDLGTGTYTIMTQIAADGLHLPVEKVKFDLGLSSYPEASVSGGSTTAASVGSAIKEACDTLKQQLKDLASKDSAGPLYKIRDEEIAFTEGRIHLLKNKNTGETYAELLKRNRKDSLSSEGATPKDLHNKKFSTHSFGAQFAEVHVHPRTGEVRVTHLVGAFAAGKILNAKTARSQFMGGMVMGLGMGLMEETVPDLRTGRFTVKDLADYHVPVSADIPKIDIFTIDENDTEVNSLGAKGIGEIGIVGTAAAIANAVFNATGVRVRDLPITPDKVIRGITKLT
jgi:xanthine dehydrogenase YagR molybdenum-binding subunit